MTILPWTGAVSRISRVLVIRAGGWGVTTCAIDLQGALSFQDGRLVQVRSTGAAAWLFWGGDGRDLQRLVDVIYLLGQGHADYTQMTPGNKNRSWIMWYQAMRLSKEEYGRKCTKDALLTDWAHQTLKACTWLQVNHNILQNKTLRVHIISYQGSVSFSLYAFDDSPWS